MASKSNVEDVILDAARACVETFGVRRTTLTDVARRAGVSRPTVYRHWPDVSALVADLLTRELRALLREEERRAAEETAGHGWSGQAPAESGRPGQSRGEYEQAGQAPAEGGRAEEEQAGGGQTRGRPEEDRAGNDRPRAGRPGEGARTRLVRHAGGVARALAAHPLFARVVDTEPELLATYTFHRLGTSHRVALEAIEPAVAEGQADGSIRPGDPEVLARTVLVTVQNTITARRLFDDLLDGEALVGELTALLDGYLAPPAH